MGSLVHREVGAVPIMLATHRFLPRMHHLVADEMGTLREGFATLGAPVQLEGSSWCRIGTQKVSPQCVPVGDGSGGNQLPTISGKNQGEMIHVQQKLGR